MPLIAPTYVFFNFYVWWYIETHKILQSKCGDIPVPYNNFFSLKAYEIFYFYFGAV